jgi:co-chaperonin GroES (HSP10)
MKINEQYYPGFSMILVEKKDVPKTGLLMSATHPVGYGKVVAVGAIEDKFIGTKPEVGNHIYFPSNAGSDIEIPEGTFRLIRVQEILLGDRTNG